MERSYLRPETKRLEEASGRPCCDCRQKGDVHWRAVSIPRLHLGWEKWFRLLGSRCALHPEIRYESHNHRRLVHSHPHDDKKPCNDRLREEPRPVEDCPTLNRPCWKPPMSGNPGPNAGTRRKCPLRFSRCHAPFHGRSGVNILRFEAQ